MKKKAISLLLVGAMVAAMVAGCGNASSNDNGAAAGGDSSAASESNSSAKSEGSKDGYTIAANIWGTGAYPLDIIVHADEKAAAVAGAKVDVADNQFTADTIVTDLQSQLASKPDAVLMFSVVDAVFGSVQELCDAQKVPYALDTKYGTASKQIRYLSAESQQARMRWEKHLQIRQLRQEIRQQLFLEQQSVIIPMISVSQVLQKNLSQKAEKYYRPCTVLIHPSPQQKQMTL